MGASPGKQRPKDLSVSVVCECGSATALQLMPIKEEEPKNGKNPRFDTNSGSGSCAYCRRPLSVTRFLFPAISPSERRPVAGLKPWTLSWANFVYKVLLKHEGFEGDEGILFLGQGLYTPGKIQGHAIVTTLGRIFFTKLSGGVGSVRKRVIKTMHVIDIKDIAVPGPTMLTIDFENGDTVCFTSSDEAIPEFIWALRVCLSVLHHSLERPVVGNSLPQKFLLDYQIGAVPDQSFYVTYRMLANSMNLYPGDHDLSQKQPTYPGPFLSLLSSGSRTLNFEMFDSSKFPAVCLALRNLTYFSILIANGNAGEQALKYLPNAFGSISGFSDLFLRNLRATNQLASLMRAISECQTAALRLIDVSGSVLSPEACQSLRTITEKCAKFYIFLANGVSGVEGDFLPSVFEPAYNKLRALELCDVHFDESAQTRIVNFLANAGRLSTLKLAGSRFSVGRVCQALLESLKGAKSKGYIRQTMDELDLSRCLPLSAKDAPLLEELLRTFGGAFRILKLNGSTFESEAAKTAIVNALFSSSEAVPEFALELSQSEGIGDAVAAGAAQMGRAPTTLILNNIGLNDVALNDLLVALNKSNVKRLHLAETLPYDASFALPGMFFFYENPQVNKPYPVLAISWTLPQRLCYPPQPCPEFQVIMKCPSCLGIATGPPGTGIVYCHPCQKTYQLPPFVASCTNCQAQFSSLPFPCVTCVHCQSSVDFLASIQPIVARLASSDSLASFFRENQTVEEFVLAGSPTRAFGSPMAAAFDGLKGNRTVVSLDVRGNLMGDGGAIALGSALRVNRTLRSLEMDGNDIGLEGLQAFRGCLYGNNKLIHCPVPLRDLQAHIDQAQAVIRQAVHDEMHARAGVKVACRMRNYHMKAQELEKLRQAIRTRKRLDSRVQKCQSLMGVIQQSVGNNQKIYAKKEEEKRLKLEVKMKEKEERMLKKAQEQEEKRKKKQRELEFRKAERERKMLQKKALKGRVTALHKMDRQIAIEQAKGADVQWYYNWKNTVADKRYLTKGDFASVSTHYAAHCQAVGQPIEKQKIVFVTNVYASAFNHEAEMFRRMRYRYPRYHYWRTHHYGHHHWHSWSSFSNFSDGHDHLNDEKLEDHEQIVENEMIADEVGAELEEEAVAEGEEIVTEVAVIEGEEELVAEEVDAEVLDEEFDEGFFDLEEDDVDPFDGEEFEADGIDDLEMYAGAEPIELKDNRDPPSDSSATSPKDKQSSEDRAEAIEAAIRSSVEQLLEREKTKLMEGRISFEEAWTPERVAEWFRVHWGQAMMRAEAQALEIDRELPYRVVMGALGVASRMAKETVTAVTQLSVDRIPALRAFVERWEGPISAAVYIRTAEDEDRIRTFYQDLNKADRDFAQRVSFSFVYAIEDSSSDGIVFTEYEKMYPINKLRNVAVDGASTDFVFCVDVDFVPSANLYNAITDVDSFSSMQEFALESRAVFVVPAFEIKPNCPYPRNVQELRRELASGAASVFHAPSFPAGHCQTDTNRWFQSRAPYEISYDMFYEPYIIGSRSTLPRYDERFRGYGMNKISHLFSVAADGHRFIVLPEVFIAAREHPRSPSWKKMFGSQSNVLHRVRIAYIFDQFKHEYNMRNGYFLQTLGEKTTLSTKIDTFTLWKDFQGRIPTYEMVLEAAKTLRLSRMMANEWDLGRELPTISLGKLLLAPFSSGLAQRLLRERDVAITAVNRVAQSMKAGSKPHAKPVRRENVSTVKC